MIPLLPAGRSRRSIAAIMACTRALRSGTYLALVTLIVAVALLLPALTRSSGAAAQTPDDDRAGAPPTLESLMATGEGRAMYPPFDPGTHHYAVGCGGGALTLSLAADEGTRMAVNGVRLPDTGPGMARSEVTGLSGDSDVVISLDNDAGGSAAYTVHCLPDDFPTITARKSADASNILIAMTASAGPGWRYSVILDTNGVPRFHRGRVNLRGFRYHHNGLYPYSEALDIFEMIDGNRITDLNFVVYDWDMTAVDIVSTVAPLTSTDSHDLLIRPNGNYILMAYEPGRHDFSSFLNPEGTPYGEFEETRDSVIQEITPEREQVFLWNSWDHMALEDCTQHRFPDGYAHINSLEVVDGDIIASFRGCSQVLRIDGTTGEIVWLLGKSNRDDADWLASDAPAPLNIVDDPYGEFCGQHSARLRPNGNLVLFDNGAHCQVDPATGTTTRESGVFSRVVEYSLDPENGRATFLRHHSLHGTFDRYARALAHVELLDNGNWLVSWGLDVSITELDPLTGRVLLEISITGDENGVRVLPSRAYPVPPDALERRPTNPLTELQPGWNRIVWRGPDGISAEDMIAGGAGLGGAWPSWTITAIHTRDAESGAWFSLFPNASASAGVNNLSVFRQGRTYWVFARTHVHAAIPHAPRHQIPDRGGGAGAE